MIREAWETVCEIAGELKRYLLAAFPPVGTSLTGVMGIPWQDWVYIATFVYTIMLSLLLLPRFYGCGRCLLQHRTCTMRCKREADSE